MIQDLLSADRIQVDLQAADRDGVVAELVQTLLQGSEGGDAEEIIKTMIHREDKGSTAILPRFALPHARTSASPGFVVSLGISREGVDFGAPDGSKTYVFFCISHHPENHGRYLDLLSRISLLFSEPSFLEGLMKAASVEEVCSLIQRREEELFTVNS